MERTLSLKNMNNEEAKYELDRLYEVRPALTEEDFDNQTEKLKFLKNQELIIKWQKIENHKR